MTVSSIYLSDQLKARLVRAARRHSFVVERGCQLQLAYTSLTWCASMSKPGSPRVRAGRWIRRWA